MEQFSPESYARNIATNILAGKNECKELQTAVEMSDSGYFEAKSRPAIDTLFFQKCQAEADRQKYLDESNQLRFALEVIAQNLVSSPSAPDVLTLQKTDFLKTTLQGALGRAVIW